MSLVEPGWQQSPKAHLLVPRDPTGLRQPNTKRHYCPLAILKPGVRLCDLDQAHVVSLFSVACVALSQHFKNCASFNWSEPTWSWILLSKKKQSQVFHEMLHSCLCSRPEWSGMRALQFRRLHPNASMVVPDSYHHVPDVHWKYPA